MQDLPQTIKIEIGVRVVLFGSHVFFQLRVSLYCLFIGYIIAFSAPQFIISWLEPAPTVGADGGAEVDDPATMILVDHDVGLFEVSMHNLLVIQEEEPHADIFNYLELSLLADGLLPQTIGVVLHEDLAVGERLNGLYLAVVFANIGAYLISHVLQEVDFVLMRVIQLFVRSLQSSLFHQHCIFDSSLFLVYNLHRVTVVDANLGDVAIYPQANLGKAALVKMGLIRFASNLDGGEDEVRPLLFRADVLQYGLHLVSEQLIHCIYFFIILYPPALSPPHRPLSRTQQPHCSTHGWIVA